MLETTRIYVLLTTLLFTCLLPSDQTVNHTLEHTFYNNFVFQRRGRSPSIERESVDDLRRKINALSKVIGRDESEVVTEEPIGRYPNSSVRDRLGVNPVTSRLGDSSHRHPNFSMSSRLRGDREWQGSGFDEEYATARREVSRSPSPLRIKGKIYVF